VFVTGLSDGGSTASVDYATLAYSTADGSQRWVKRFNSAPSGFDESLDLAVSTDGTRLFVTGLSDDGSKTRGDFATVAYDTANGTPQWLARYNGPANYVDYGTRIAASPDGTKVFVTGVSNRADTTTEDYVTISYRATVAGG
jgi:hypothetical protein